MAEKLKSFVFRWKYEAVIFFMTMIPVIVNYKQLTGIHRTFLPFYLYDLSLGFNSRTIVGSFIKLFNSSPTEEWIISFARIILISGMLLTAIALGKVVKKAKSEHRFSIFVVILFFVSGSLTISVFSRFFGMLDIHMYILTLLAVVFAENKYLRWFIPVLCAMGTMVNYVFTISYFPFIILAMLYFADKNEKKLSRIILFSVTAIVTLGLTFYFVFDAYNHMFVTYDEALRLMEEKIGYPFSEKQAEYLGIYLFGHHYIEQDFGVAIPELSPTEYIYYFIKFICSSGIFAEGVVTLLIISLPIIAAFWTVWIMCIKNAEKKSTKFVYLCCLLSTLCIPVCCVLSTDLVRWIASGLMCQFGMCFLLFYTRDEAFDKTVNKIKEFFSRNKILPVIIYAIYASCMYLNLAT